MDIEKLIASAAALPPFYADVCMLAADEIKALRAKLEDPDLANLRCLEGSVKNLIARLSRHDGSVLRDHHNTDGTISGDLYAIVATLVGNRWDNDTLSDLQRRYPLPRPVAEPQARPSGSGELPGVPREVCDRGRDAERGGVCGSADEFPALTRAENLAADLIAELAADVEPPATVILQRGQTLFMQREELEAMLEQARSKTRRNILTALQGGVFPPPGLPQQDVAVAVAILRRKVDAEHKMEERATYAEDQMRKARAEAFGATAALSQRESELLGTIKGRDKTIDRLCRHIAFQVAK